MGEGNEAQRRLIEDLRAGLACEECGEPITPGEPCECCAYKAAMLKAAFPKLYGDA